ncbi:pilus biosynthesis protein TadE [Marinicauda pacifica]|jgi:Flp pilus assembly protein TadG|uniref:Pilus assembly protein n=1 Tax=Marinicauda pacifica TaxID=1133559 RepID=A0A4S2HB28_9PROT|nr:MULTISPECIES: TadE/TadG family type IV pilus assembly protein [Marinicauda]TGY92858.1 pilus assembly protein [Marinicauda pacifica]GGE40919.1 pilus biosynthesis protein TadE [Marinicauda pacifica]
MARLKTRTGFIKRFARERSGATAVEFALVALPFFTLIMAIIEIALVFFVGTMMDNALNESAREIRTGRLQTQGGSEESFRDELCRRVAMISDCTLISVDVRTYENFSQTDFSSPIGAGGSFDSSGFNFTPGGPSDIVVVRAYYPMKLFLPSIGLANLPGNKRLIASATAFRNEPYQ